MKRRKLTIILALIVILGGTLFAKEARANHPADDISFSISAWVNMDDATNFWILSKGTRDYPEYAFGVNANDILSLTIHDGSMRATSTIWNATSSYIQALSNSALTNDQNTWTFLTAAYNGSATSTGMRLYRNAELVSQTINASSTYVRMHNHGERAVVGALFIDGSVFANGTIDDLRAYPYARTIEEIRLDYNSGLAARFGGSPNKDINKNLVGYWQFNEGAGQAAIDSSDSKNNGVLGANGAAAIDDPSWTAATGTVAENAGLGGVLDFDGIDEFITVADSDSLSFGDSTHDFPFSISAWVNLQDTASGTPNPIFAKGSLSAREYLFGFNEHNSLFMTLFDDTANNYINATGTGSFEPYQDSWAHVAATYSGSRSAKGIKLYKNGVPQKISASSTVAVGTYTAMTNTAQSAVIGRNFNNGAAYASLRIDELRLYNRELTLDEILYIYNKKEPLAHYKLDEGAGGKVYSSGGGNAGTLQNIATSTAWVVGQYGTALYFDGIDDFALIPDNLALSFNASFSKVFHSGAVNCYDGAGASRACKGTDEDADLDATPKSYTNAGCGAGTVVDNHTGLCWQKDDQTSRPWDNALDYCRTLSLGEHSDWRLPTAIEAVTMLDYSCSDVANAHCSSDFNNNALNWVNGSASSYWTSSTRSDDTTGAYVINASSGNLDNGTKTNSNFVRCVRQAN